MITRSHPVVPFRHQELAGAVRQVTRFFEEQGLTYEQTAYVR